MTPGGVVPNPNFFDHLYTYAWFVTFALSAAIYLATDALGTGSPCSVRARYANTSVSIASLTPPLVPWPSRVRDLRDEPVEPDEPEIMPVMNTGSYVNGKWYQPSSKTISKNINPADTGDVIAEYPLATAADVRLAIDAAVAAWPAWQKTPGPERGRVLWRAADIARRRVDEIAQHADARGRQDPEGSARRGAEGHLAARVLRRRRLPHARQDAAVRIARHVHLHRSASRSAWSG